MPRMSRKSWLNAPTSRCHPRHSFLEHTLHINSMLSLNGMSASFICTDCGLPGCSAALPEPCLSSPNVSVTLASDSRQPGTVISAGQEHACKLCMLVKLRVNRFLTSTLALVHG